MNKKYELVTEVGLDNGCLFWLDKNEAVDIFPNKRSTKKKYKVYAKINRNKKSVDELRIIFA